MDRAIILWTAKKSKAFKISVDVDNAFRRVQQVKLTAQTTPDEAYLPHQVGSSLAIDEVMSKHIKYVLGITNGKISGKRDAAELLQLKTSTLRAKMKKFGLL